MVLARLRKSRKAIEKNIDEDNKYEYKRMGMNNEYTYPWREGVTPPAKFAALNNRLKKMILFHPE